MVGQSSMAGGTSLLISEARPLISYGLGGNAALAGSKWASMAVVEVKAIQVGVDGYYGRLGLLGCGAGFQ